MKQFEHQKNLFKKLIESKSFGKEKAIFESIFKGSIWWAAEENKKPSFSGLDKFKQCVCEKKRMSPELCAKKLSFLMRKAKKIKKPVFFSCGFEKNGVCFPFIQGSKIYGYVLICHSKSELLPALISAFSNFIDTFLRELQKELELTKLYETIRPRAIALSTIHTIHRIMSSTLNIGELLPKIARLCMQVLRAEKCCIILKNKGKKSTVIHMVNGAAKEKNMFFDNKSCERLIRKKVLSNGKILTEKNLLCVPLIDEDIIGAIYVINKINKEPFNMFDKEILMTFSEQAAIAIKNAKLYEEQKNITLGSIKSLAAVLNTRSPGCSRPKESFTKIVLGIGKNLHLSSEDIRSLHYATILHDAGQIAFPDKMLVKTGKLSGKEYNMVRSHPGKGVSIIKHISILKPIIPIILHHHENFDGSGYPKGLKGEKIPLGARIMAVADAFSAMVTKRPYRQNLDMGSAIAEIKKNAGTQFDPRVIQAFLKVITDKDIISLIKNGM